MTLPSVADTGSVRGPVATPLDLRKSTSSPDRRLDAQFVAATIPARGAHERQLADLVGNIGNVVGDVVGMS